MSEVSPDKPGRPLLRLFPILVLNVVELGIALPVLPALVYAAGGDAIDVGAMYTVQAIGQFLMAPGWGGLSDRFGRKPILLATFLLAAVFEVLTALVPTLALIYAVRFVVGLCAGNVAAASALIADVTTDEDRSKGMALVGISFGLGFTIGPAIGAVISHFAGSGMGPTGVGAPFVAAGVLSAITFLIAIPVLFEPRRAEERAAISERRRLSWEVVRSYLKRPAFVTMCGIFFTYTMAVSILEATFFIFVEDRFNFGAVEVGYAFAGLGLLMAAVQGSVGRVSKKYSETAMALGGGLVVGAGLIAAPFAATAVIFLALAAFSTIGRAYLHPALLSAASKQSPSPDEVGRVMGLVQSSGTMGRIAGPALGGWLFAQVATGAPFWAAGGIMTISILVWFVVYSRTR